MPTVVIVQYEIKITHGHTLKVNKFLVFRGFANLRDRPKNIRTSIRPFSGLGHQNCFTALTCLGALTHDAQGVEGKSMELL
jgi:hypothetical protein